MSSNKERVLGRKLAVEEMRTVAGGTDPFADSIWTETGTPPNGDETSPAVDTRVAFDSGTTADSAPTVDPSNPVTETGIADKS